MCISTQTKAVLQKENPGSVHVDTWPNMTTLLRRIFLETEAGLVRSYSAQDQPSGLELFTGLRWLGLETRPMPGSLLAIANLRHFKTRRVANTPSILAYFSICITVGVRINDSDFGADVVTLSQSYAAFHHIRSNVQYTNRFFSMVQERYEEFYMHVQLKGQFELVEVYEQTGRQD